MKQTGIVRRIDDVGRVHIPKQISRALGFKNGDPLEIFTDTEKGQAIIQKFVEKNEKICMLCGFEGVTVNLYPEKQVCSSCVELVVRNIERLRDDFALVKGEF